MDDNVLVQKAINNKSIIIQASLEDLETVFEKIASRAIEKNNQTVTAKSNQTDGPEHFFTRDEVRQILGGVSEQTIINYEKAGKLKSHQVGRKKLYKWEDIQKAMK